MQHALLGFAIALILAIVAALAAPAYVNWDDWRSAFESRATALTGTPVRINGKIEASVLPTPAFVFRDVVIGDPDEGTGVRVGELRGILSLGPLLRGVLEAEEFVLVRPAMRLAAEQGGSPALPAALAAARGTGIVALARITVERGSLVIEDRTSGELVMLDEISADGEVRAREGPMRIDAVFRRDGRRWSLRANAGRFGEEGAGRVRFTLERAGDGTLFDAEGMLSLAGNAPRFEGKFSAIRRKGPGLPWQIAVNAKASEAAVSLDAFELTLGANAAPLDLAGRVQFEPRRGGRIDGALSARRLDLDLASGGEAAKGLPGAAMALREVLALLNDMPFAGRIGLSVEALIAGGGTVRDLQAELDLRGNALAVHRFEARLPGRGSLTASGPAEDDAFFRGDVLLQAEDAAALLHWAIGDAASSLKESGALRLAGTVDWTQERIAVFGIDFALGAAKLGGSVSLKSGEGKQRARIDARLAANDVDLDLLMPLGRLAQTGTEGADLALAIEGRDLRVLGRPLRKADVALSRSGNALAVERFVIEDFDGLSGLARGRIVGPPERPGGRIDFELETARPEGLAAIVARMANEDTAKLVSRIAGKDRPLRLFGAAVGAGAAAGIEITANGYLAGLEASLAANIDTLAQTLSEANVTLESRDPGKLVSLFGLMPGLPAPGDGTIELLFAKPDAGAMPVAARLIVPGAKLSAEGEFRNGEGGRIEPSLNLRLEADDLRPSLMAVAHASGDAAVPAEGKARLVRKGDEFALDAIAVHIGGSEVRGAIAVDAADDFAVAGKLAVERMQAATLLALSVGSAPAGKSFWPAARLAPPPLAKTKGSVELDVKTLGLPGQLVANGAALKLKLGPAEISIEDFSAELAGGKLAGHARFVRGDTLAFDGRVTLDAFSVERLLASEEGKVGVRGRGKLTLALAGNGETPAAVAGSFAGQGAIVLEKLEIDRADPNAVHAVLAMPEQSEPRDEIAVIAALSPALAKGPLRLDKIEAPLVVANGVARSGKARVQAGPAQATLEGVLDLARLTFEAAVEMEVAPPPGLTVRPAATVRWRGPIAAPEREIEAAPLATAITLRAMERETKRIEERDRALPPRTQTAPAAPYAIEAQPLAAIPGEPQGNANGGSGSPAGSEQPAPVAPPPLPPTRPRSVAPAPRTALPPLAPPIEIRPAPGAFPQH